MSNATEQTQVLLLDDEPIVCRRLKPSLEKSGYAVEVFTNSRSALDRLRQKSFDIVITDLKMDGVEGMDLLAEVKKLAKNSAVIVITGFATRDTAEESFQKGVFDFVAKPFKPSEIQAVVRRAEAQLRKRSGLAEG